MSSRLEGDGYSASRMRRLSLLLAVCLVSLVAACGGDDESGGPLDSALSYVPEGTPFVVAIDTDLEGDQYGSVQSILNQFPGGVNIEDLLRDQLASGVDGVSYEEDVKPLLGNPFVVSATDVTSFLDDSEDDDFVAAIQVKDGEALDRVIDATAPEQSSEVAGATVYEDDGSFFAVDEDMVVFAGSRELLEAALERAEAGDGLDPASFEEGLADLPDEGLARVYLDLQALIDQDPDTEAARKVDWVAALRTLGMTAVAKDDALELELNLRTEGEDLSDDSLPLAAGDEAPGVVRREGEFGFGLRDPSQLIGFFESAFQAIDPASYGDYETGKQAIAASYDIDLDEDVFDQMTGDLSVSVAVDGSFGARAEVADPGAFARTIDRVAKALPELGASLGVSAVRPAGRLYEAQLADGGRLAFGVSNEVFVVASTPARALAMAEAEPSQVDGAQGSFVMTADAERVALQVIDALGLAAGRGRPAGRRPVRPPARRAERLTRDEHRRHARLVQPDAGLAAHCAAQACSSGSGSIGSPPANQPPTQISKCRCGPEERPVLPTSPMRWPVRTRWPLATGIDPVAQVHEDVVVVLFLAVEDHVVAGAGGLVLDRFDHAAARRHHGRALVGGQVLALVAVALAARAEARVGAAPAEVTGEREDVVAEHQLRRAAGARAAAQAAPGDVQHVAALGQHPGLEAGEGDRVRCPRRARRGRAWPHACGRSRSERAVAPWPPDDR